MKRILSSEKNNMFWIPAGFAHGFVALEDHTLFLYKTTKRNPMILPIVMEV